jgi:hypothetical protein
LSSQPRETALVVVELDDSGGRILRIDEHLADDELAPVLLDPGLDKIGIDAPFGWPTPFVEALRIYAARGEWPEVAKRELMFRATDFAVRELTGRWPLSVSTDRISFTAIRCARLLSELARRGQPVQRDGSGKIAEVYPAAALRKWGLVATGYKRGSPAARALRRELAGAVARRFSLELDAESLRAFEMSDHKLDAFVAALVAAACARGMTIPPGHAQSELVLSEGWIHLPMA